LVGEGWHPETSLSPSRISLLALCQNLHKKFAKQNKKKNNYQGVWHVQVMELV